MFLTIPPVAHCKHTTAFRFRSAFHILQEHEHQQHSTTCGEQPQLHVLAYKYETHLVALITSMYSNGAER